MGQPLKLRASDPKLETLELDRGPVAFVDEGSGPVVVCVHGAPGTHRDFRWLAPALAQHFRVVRFDMPGFGRTPTSTMPSARLHSRAHFVHEVMQRLELEAPILLGHSMGGPVAMATAALDPERVSGVAVLASVGASAHRGIRETPSAKMISMALRTPGVKKAVHGPLRRGFLAAGFSKSFSTDAFAHSIHCVARLRFDEVGRYADAIGRSDLPALVAYAEDDRLIEAEIGEDLARRLPGGPRLVFPTGGHNVQKSHAAEIAQALLELRAVPRAAGATAVA